MRIAGLPPVRTRARCAWACPEADFSSRQPRMPERKVASGFTIALLGKHVAQASNGRRLNMSQSEEEKAERSEKPEETEVDDPTKSPATGYGGVIPAEKKENPDQEKAREQK
jgi:hypothetical protein